MSSIPVSPGSENEWKISGGPLAMYWATVQRQRKATGNHRDRLC